MTQPDRAARIAEIRGRVERASKTPAYMLPTVTANYCEDIPFLLAEVERLEAETTSMKTLVDILERQCERESIEAHVELENVMGHECNQVDESEEPGQ